MNLLELDLDELLEVVRALPVAYHWKRAEAIGRKLVEAEDVKGEAAKKAAISMPRSPAGRWSRVKPAGTTMDGTNAKKVLTQLHYGCRVKLDY